jgi:enamine deaminase RidA (YjgF/YER057c/UK114 family)
VGTVPSVRASAGSGSPYESTIGFSRAVRVGDRIVVSGTAPVWPDGHVDPDPLVQARRCWEIALTALDELGGSPTDVVRTRTYITDRSVEAAAGQAHGEHFAAVRPASTMVIVAGLLDERWLVEVEVEAIVGSGGT